MTDDQRVAAHGNLTSIEDRAQHQTTSMDVSRATVGFRSAAHSAGLEEIAVRLCLNQCTRLCPHVWVPILRPRRPCIRSPASDRRPSDDPSRALLLRRVPFVLDDSDDDEEEEALLPPKNKRVVFADSRGLSLAAVRVFSTEDEEEEEDQDQDQDDLGPSPPPGPGGATDDGYSRTVSTCCPGTRLTLGFPPPSADFRAFRAKLASGVVTLESCSVAGRALRGTVRVRDAGPRKDVRVRITFDSWRSHADVPCAHVPRRFGGPQTDVFEFDIAVPKVLDAKRRIEFCVVYRAGGQSEAFWDNNGGRNYSVAVCVSSHLCRGGRK